MSLCSNDSEEEIQAIVEMSKQAGAYDAVVSDHWANGGKRSLAYCNLHMRSVYMRWASPANRAGPLE